MKSNKNIGLVAGNNADSILKMSHASKENGYTVKKILVTDISTTGAIQSQYPQGELVDNHRSILEDEAIDLIVVSGKPEHHVGLVGEALQAGKHVRII